jgi:hypothetical protein
MLSIEILLVCLVLAAPTLSRTFEVFSITRQNHLRCAGGWTTEAISGITYCRKATSASGCYSVFSSVPPSCYTRVSGFTTLYQWGTTDAFHAVNGVHAVGDSLTIWAGSNLLWDYAVGWSMQASPGSCPPSTIPSPLVQSKYNCSSSCRSFYTGYCHGNPPKFISTPLFGPSVPFSAVLPSTCSPIELRLCLSEDATNENIFVGTTSIVVEWDDPTTTTTAVTNATSSSSSSSSTVATVAAGAVGGVAIVVIVALVVVLLARRWREVRESLRLPFMSSASTWLPSSILYLPVYRYCDHSLTRQRTPLVPPSPLSTHARNHTCTLPHAEPAFSLAATSGLQPHSKLAPARPERGPTALRRAVLR